MTQAQIERYDEMVVLNTQAATAESDAAAALATYNLKTTQAKDYRARAKVIADELNIATT